MTRRAGMLGVMLLSSLEIGCSASKLKPFTVPAGQVSGLSGSGSVDVSARALQPGSREIQVMGQGMQIDEQQFAELLQEAIAKELAQQGFSLAKGAPNKLDLMVLHVSVVGGAPTITCYVDFVVFKPDGTERGFEGRGSGKPYESCQSALEKAAVTVLNDPEIRAAIKGQPSTLAEGERSR